MKDQLWKRIGIILLAGMLAVGLLFWLIFRDRGDAAGQAEIGNENHPRLSALGDQTRRVDGALRKVALAKAEREERVIDPYEAWGTQTILDRFGVPPGRFTDASLGEAVEYLRKVFDGNGGRGIEFRIEGGEGHPITCEFGNVGASSLMELVAGLGGYEVRYGDGEVVFRRKAPVPAFPMHEMRLDARILMTLDDQHDNGISIAAKLARYGLRFDDGAQIEVEELEGGSEVAVILNSAEENDRLLALYQFLTNDSRLGNILLTPRMISVPADQTELVTESYRDADFQEVIRGLSQTDGANLLSAPSIVFTPGQKAKVEIIREVLIPISWGENGEPTGLEIENIGRTLSVEAQIVGLERLQLTGRVVHSLAEGQKLGDVEMDGVPGRVASADQIRKLATEFEGELFDGNTAGFSSGEEEGVGVQQFVTVRRLLPDGQPMAK